MRLSICSYRGREKGEKQGRGSGEACGAGRELRRQRAEMREWESVSKGREDWVDEAKGVSEGAVTGRARREEGDATSPRTRIDFFWSWRWTRSRWGGRSLCTAERNERKKSQRRAGK